MNPIVGAPGVLTQGQVDALVREAAEAAGWTNTDDAWSWRFTGAVVELRTVLRIAADPNHRAQLIAAGKVLLNLRMLIKGLGVHSAVSLLPDSSQRDLIAIVRLDGPRSVTDQDRSLVAALLTGPSEKPAIGTGSSPASLITTLRRAAKTEQAWLAVQPMATFQAAIPHDDGMRSSGTVLIIGTVLDGFGAQLQAGQATQRVTLTAAALGLPVRSMGTVLQSSMHRQAVRDLIGGGLWPQTLLDLAVDAHRQPR